ncbi:unnamed protein product [Ambrosiozyma monospora]|uniref:Unnamed protein product n=1 Tax=Ambrosiozyma monospora TaxID=43982 RepID=A0A9W6YS97_AMBMO|nr:unnamed protein product [Ambrosiozyma monospora]
MSVSPNKTEPPSGSAKRKNLFQKFKSKFSINSNRRGQSPSSSVDSETSKNSSLLASNRSTPPTDVEFELKKVKPRKDSQKKIYLGSKSVAGTSKDSNLLADSKPPLNQDTMYHIPILPVKPPVLTRVEEYEAKIKNKTVPMLYNPFGSMQPLNSRVDPKDDKNNNLPFPIHMPNDYLPIGFQIENQNLYDDYKSLNGLGKNIGKGASCSVLKISKKKTPKGVYAFKKFVLFHDEKPDEFYKRASKEYIIHRNLFNGLHIVKCYSLLKVPSEPGKPGGWGFVLELAKCDLFSVIQSKKWSFSTLNEKLCIFKQITFGLKFIHECDIVHRDLKPENILLARNGIIKITDFGVSDYGHNIPGDWSSGCRLSTQLVGSPPYNSPEVQRLSSVPIAKRTHYNPFKMDYWSLGVILFVLISSNVPFSSCSTKDLSFKEYVDAYMKVYPSFMPLRQRNETTRGPSLGSRFTRMFPNKGIARLAWRLCDPNGNTRYTVYDIFNDPAFQNIEVCVEENEFGCNFMHHKVSSFNGKYKYNDVNLHTNGSISAKTKTRTTAPTFSSSAPMIKKRSMLDVLDESPKPDILDEITNLNDCKINVPLPTAVIEPPFEPIEGYSQQFKQELELERTVSLCTTDGLRKLLISESEDEQFKLLTFEVIQKCGNKVNKKHKH